MMPRDKIQKIGDKLIEQMNNRNHTSRNGVPIALPSNDTLSELNKKFWDGSKRKRKGNMADNLQDDIDRITAKIKVV